jgi:hypothetical protein
MILPDPLPKPNQRAKPVIPRPLTPPPRAQKRPAADDLDGTPAKRARLASTPNNSPGTSRRLEEDGLILLDDDIVVID